MHRPDQTVEWRAPLLLALAFLPACGGNDEGPPIRATLDLPRLTVAASPPWTGMAAGDDVVAVTGGIPIPASRYGRALRSAGSESDPRQVLDDLVARELLAQEAVRTSPGGFVVPAGPVYGRALATRLLRKRFVEQFRPADVPEEELQQFFRIPQIFGKFNHLRLFTVLDYQWICCAGDESTCRTADAESCFREGAAAMEALHDSLVREPPDPEDLPLLLDRYRTQAPRLSFQQYDFAYDDDARVQKGTVLIDDNVVEGVVAASPGQFADRAVRSKFGWHVLFVKDMLPPVRRDLSDPEVRREVSEFFYPRFQQKRVVDYLAQLLPVKGFRMLEQAFRERLPTAPPRYPVVLHPDTLAEAIEMTLRQKEAEPM